MTPGEDAFMLDAVVDLREAGSEWSADDVADECYAQIQPRVHRLVSNGAPIAKYIDIVMDVLWTSDDGPFELDTTHFDAVWTCVRDQLDAFGYTYVWEPVVIELLDTTRVRLVLKCEPPEDSDSDA